MQFGLFFLFPASSFTQYIYVTETFFWFQEDRISLTGKDARNRELTTYAHACFLIKIMSQRDEHVRDISVNLLTQLRDKFPQVKTYGSTFSRSKDYM